MNKLCSNSSESSEDDSNYYVKGYNINYDTLNSKSDLSNSEFLNSVFEKSFSPKNKSTQGLEKETQTALSPAEIRDRCRISYECRNKMICIEGRPLSQKKY
jgi:hypothetical protein